MTSSGRSPSGGMGRACSVGRVGCAVPGPVGAVLHIRPAPAGGESAESCENTPAFNAGEILPCAERTLLHMGALPLKTDLLERTPESCGKPGIHPQGRPFPMCNTSTTGPGRPRPAREGPHREPGPVRAPRETPPPPRRSPAPHRRPRRERPGEPFSSGWQAVAVSQTRFVAAGHDRGGTRGAPGTIRSGDVSKSVTKAPRGGIDREKNRRISTILFRTSGVIRAFVADLDNRCRREPLGESVMSQDMGDSSVSGHR